MSKKFAQHKTQAVLVRNRASKAQPRPERERLIQAIAARRQELGLSQRELSRRLGVHELTVARLERGERGLDVTDLLDIAEILKVDPLELFKVMLQKS